MRHQFPQYFSRIAILITGFLFLFHIFLFSSSYIKVYYLKAGEHEYVFYADNENYCPYQILVNLKNADQLCLSVHVPFYTKLKPQEKGLYLFSVITWQNPSNSLAFTVEEAMGDPDAVPDTNFIYFIPFEEGTEHMVNQGYKGSFSHQAGTWIQYSIDFGMNIGTPVCAARDGVVVDVKEDSSWGGLRYRYAKLANYITVYHKDGSFGEYVHLMKNGSLVKPGDSVKKGQIIGFSGNTGFTGGPHLHFMVYKAFYMRRETFPTLFLGDNNSLIDPGHKRRQFFVSYHHENSEFYAGSSITNQIPVTSMTSATNNPETSETNFGGL